MSAAESRTPSTALEYALAYAALGWSVVPVRRGEKMPAVAWSKFQTLPAQPTDIRGWFDTAPEMGVGLVQGRNASSIVLDFDGELGMQTLRQLEARGLPDSVRALTPGGGVHVYLRHPGVPVATRKGVLPGMDVRGDGGFVVAPPSRHANGGQYHWDVDCHPEDAPLADLPPWLLPALEAPVEGAPHLAEITRGEGYDGAPGRVQDGREAYMRDTVLAVVRDLRTRLRRLPTEAEVVEQGWPQYARNVDFSRPGRGLEEFKAKVRYTLARAQAGAIRGFELPQAVHSPAEPAAEGQGASVPDGLLPLVYFKDAKPSLDAADFVEGLLTERAMSVVYGPSNCGKTFFMTDLSLHVATGRPWRGREIEPGGVIYCALEGGHGITNRVAAFAKAHGLEGYEVPFATVPAALNLREPEAGDQAKLAATIKVAAEEMGGPVKLVVIDTLSRALAGGDENGSEDMGAVVAAADKIREVVAAHVCFIHHSGKDESRGARGHSLLRAATDTEIEVSRPDSTSPSVARVTKQREMEIEGEFVFRLDVVELGTNRRGKPVTSCVVRHDDGPAPEVQRPLPDGAKAALDALREALARNGRSPPPGADMPSGIRAVVWLSEWRREFYARSTAETQEAKQKAFIRNSREVIKRSLAAVLNDHAWMITES
jgi:hypothetical protein